jgi:regulator of replication initiation timing
MKGFHNISVTALHNRIATLMTEIVEEREKAATLRKQNKKLRMEIVELNRQIDELHRLTRRKGKEE